MYLGNKSKFPWWNHSGKVVSSSIILSIAANQNASLCLSSLSRQDIEATYLIISEHEVYRMAVYRYTNVEIAEYLHTSLNTINIFFSTLNL